MIRDWMRRVSFIVCIDPTRLGSISLVRARTAYLVRFICARCRSHRDALMTDHPNWDRAEGRSPCARRRHVPPAGCSRDPVQGSIRTIQERRDRAHRHHTRLPPRIFVFDATCPAALFRMPGRGSRGLIPMEDGALDVGAEPDHDRRAQPQQEPKGRLHHELTKGAALSAFSYSSSASPQRRPLSWSD